MVATRTHWRVAAAAAFALVTLSACGGLRTVSTTEKTSTKQSAQDDVPVRVTKAQIEAHPPMIREWLTTDGRVAHRGGSANYPEMSRYAYDRALEAGYRALEISLARTSDGVWFGLHDRFLDRTSGTTEVQASKSTWAEIQEHRITAVKSDHGNPGNQPYLTLQEFLKAYDGKAVLFIDPKKSVAYADELLDILDALPGDATQRIVAKHVWRSGNSPWLAEAQARGYTTWRAFGRSADFEQHHHDADLLGMSYKASSDVWKSIKALGKPVIAHTVPDARAAKKALRKGADALMVSGVTAVRHASVAGGRRDE